MYSKIASKYLRNLNPFIARELKKVLVYPRYYRSLWLGRLYYKKYKDLYKQNILFVAGLPKSGTTWVENMLSSYPGFVSIMPFQVTGHEMEYKSSCEYDFPKEIFKPLSKGFYVMKMHSHGSKHNIHLLKENNIHYCVIYRDLRDAAVSHYFYVHSTPWHPEYPDYKNLDVRQGLIHFHKTRLEEWSRWIESWRENRDRKQSIEITYEEMLNDSFNTFRKVVSFFGLNDSEKQVKSIIERNKFKKLKAKEDRFFRKGISGDWKNYFDKETRNLYKEKISHLLIKLGYEKDHNW